MISTRALVNFWLDVSSLLVMLCLTASGGIMYFVLPPGTGHSRHLFGLSRHDFGEIHFYLAVTAMILLALHVALHWSWVCGVIARVLGRLKPSPEARRAWGSSVLIGLPAVIALALWWASGQVERSSGTLLAQGEHAVEPRQTDVFQDEHAERRQAVDDPREGSGHETGALAEVEPEMRQETEIAAHERRPRPRRRPHAQGNRSEDCPAGAAINGQTTLSEAARACRLSVQQMRDRLGLPASASAGERLGRLKRWHGFDIHAVRRLACQN